MRLCEANCGQSRSFVQGKMAAQMVQFGPKVIPCGTAQMEAFGTPFFSGHTNKRAETSSLLAVLSVLGKLHTAVL